MRKVENCCHREWMSKQRLSTVSLPPLGPRALESQLPAAGTFLIGHWRPTATTLPGAEHPIQQSDPKGRPLHTLLEVTGEQPKGGSPAFSLTRVQMPGSAQMARLTPWPRNSQPT